jgi:Double zinc ribbon
VIIELVAAVLLAVLVLWMVAGPLTAGDSPRSAALDEIVPAEETRRGQALLALKDIDFDRATGKLSESDYARLREKYVAEALDVLRNDEAAAAPAPPAGAPAPDPAEALVAYRAQVLSGGNGHQATVCPKCGPRPEADALFCSGCGDPIGAAEPCESCGAKMPPGSRFCPACGQRAEIVVAG